MNRVVPMISAELLKLRRRRGLFWLSLVLVVGGVVIVNVFLTAYHASDPVKYGPAGGVVGMTHSETLFGLTIALAAILIGATAGAQDVEAGVFRGLVATGQSRLTMALVRIPAALVMLLPMVLGAYALEVGAVFVFAGGTATPDATTLLVFLGWLVAVAMLNLTAALGLASLLRSRSFAIGVLVAWELAGSRIIERISALGSVRVGAPTIATDRLLPGATDAMKLGASCTAPGQCTPDLVTLSVTGALIVIVAWIIVATALGAWRTVTQEA